MLADPIVLVYIAKRDFHGDLLAPAIFEIRINENEPTYQYISGFAQDAFLKMGVLDAVGV